MADGPQLTTDQIKFCRAVEAMRLDLLRSGKEPRWLVAHPGVLELTWGPVNGELCGLRVVELSSCPPHAFYLSHRKPETMNGGHASTARFMADPARTAGRPSLAEDEPAVQPRSQQPVPEPAHRMCCSRRGIVRPRQPGREVVDNPVIGGEAVAQPGAKRQLDDAHVTARGWRAVGFPPGPSCHCLGRFR